MKQDKLKELKSLDNDNIVWIIFIILSLLNINADNHQKKYIITNNYNEKNNADNIFKFTIIISIIIYLFIFNKNYSSYQKTSNKELSIIKLSSTIFFILGGLCLLYYEENKYSEERKNE